MVQEGQPKQVFQLVREVQLRQALLSNQGIRVLPGVRHSQGHLEVQLHQEVLLTVLAVAEAVVEVGNTAWNLTKVYNALIA